SPTGKAPATAGRGRSGATGTQRPPPTGHSQRLFAPRTSPGRQRPGYPLLRRLRACHRLAVLPAVFTVMPATNAVGDGDRYGGAGRLASADGSNQGATRAPASAGTR